MNNQLSGLDLIKSALIPYIPSIDDDMAGYILWNFTGFPGFWNIPEDGSTPAECLTTQIERICTRLAVGEPVDQVIPRETIWLSGCP